MAGLIRLLAAALMLGTGVTYAETAPSPVPAQLRGVWQWVETVTPVETVHVDAPDRYQLSFPEAGQIALKADCNRAAGGVTFGEAGAMKIGPLAMTRAMCPPGSLSDRFARDVERAVLWSFRGDTLLLDLPFDSGTLHFERER